MLPMNCTAWFWKLAAVFHVSVSCSGPPAPAPPPSVLCSWCQHIFIDPSAPRDSYRLTYNCAGVGDNAMTYNDGGACGHQCTAGRLQTMRCWLCVLAPAHPARVLHHLNWSADPLRMKADRPPLRHF